MDYLQEVCRNARESRFPLQTLSTEKKNAVLLHLADKLVQEKEKIRQANRTDMENGRKNGLKEGLLDRLFLDENRIISMAEGLQEIASLPDPIGEVMEEFERPNGLKLVKTRIPIGVIGIIYEARPNVTADAFGLCFKTSNVVILKGGSDAFSSNKAIVSLLQEGLREEGVKDSVLSLIEDNRREVTDAFMKMDSYIDLLIPRGGSGLIEHVRKNSSIPVIATGTGNCHIYIDEDADLSMAIPIILNAKTQRIGVCNACESLLVHEKLNEDFLIKLQDALLEKNVEIRADEKLRKVMEHTKPASEEDYGKEYLDLILSIKTVSSVQEAVEHINRYGTGHSESIITENKEHAEYFLSLVDSACVYVNASTRFTDGFEFGFGAEIGISTQKLHARGPMGLRELTSYKYKIYGNGQVR